MKKLAALILAGAAAFSFAGCQAPKEALSSLTPEAESSVSASADTPKREDIIIYSNSEPDTLDQHDTETLSTATLSRNLYANLYRLNADGTLVPELADHFTVNDDFTEYTFTLKDNLKFSDGSPLTASDVVYTFQRAKDGGGTYYKELQELQALDERTVIITLKRSNNAFLNELTTEYMCVMSQTAIENGMDVDNLPTITSGAYTVEQWVKGKYIQLKANPYYLDGEPSIKTAKILYQLPDIRPYQALLNGTIDYISSVSTEEIPYLKADDNVELISYDNLAWNFLSLNETDPHLSDIHVRNAIYYALDLEYIIDTALDGLATPAPLIVNGSISGYLPGCDTVDFNLNRAKECMAASAYPDGFDLTIEVGTETREKVAKEIAVLLSEIGIRVTIERKEISEVLRDWFDYSYTATISSYSMASRIISHAAPLFRAGDSLNFSRSPDGEIGELLEKSTEADNDEKTQYLAQAYQRMKELNLYIGLYWPTIYDAKNASLQQSEPVISEKFIIANMSWE